jgi:micrococcal nuclease
MTYDQVKCDYIYKVSEAEVVDGDTVDLLLDLGFDVFLRQRVRLRGIDTPESRTSDPIEKIYGNLSKQKITEWCKKKTSGTDDGCTIELRCQNNNSREKFGRVLGEIWVSESGIWTNVNLWMCSNAYAVPYDGKNKNDIQAMHFTNRRILLSRGEVQVP